MSSRAAGATVAIVVFRLREPPVISRRMEGMAINLARPNVFTWRTACRVIGGLLFAVLVVTGVVGLVLAFICAAHAGKEPARGAETSDHQPVPTLQRPYFRVPITVRGDHGTHVRCAFDPQRAP